MISKAFSNTTLVQEREAHLISVGGVEVQVPYLAPFTTGGRKGSFLLLQRRGVQAFHQASAVATLFTEALSPHVLHGH